MITEQQLLYVRALLLRTEITMHGMAAENENRKQRGESMAYDASLFNDLADEIGENTIVRLLTEGGN